MSIFGLYNFGHQHKKCLVPTLDYTSTCSTITLVKVYVFEIFIVYLNCNGFKSDFSALFLYACVGFLSTAASRVFAVTEQCPSTPTRGQNGPVGVTACTRTGTLTFKYAHILQLSLVVGSGRCQTFFCNSYWASEFKIHFHSAIHVLTMHAAVMKGLLHHRSSR